MKIETTGFNQPIQNDTKLMKRTDASEGNSQDHVRTSEKALMLSRHAAALREHLQPREEVLRKFSGIADTPLELDDSTIDRILARM